MMIGCHLPCSKGISSQQLGHHQALLLLEGQDLKVKAFSAVEELQRSVHYTL